MIEYLLLAMNISFRLWLWNYLLYFLNISFRISLLAMNKYNLKNTAIILQNNLNYDRNSIYFQWYFLALDIIDSKIFKPTISKAKRKASISICKMFCLSNSVELINVPIFFLIHLHLLTSNLMIALL